MKLQGQLLQGASTPSTCSLLDTGTRPIKQGCVTYYTRQRTLLDRDVKPIRKYLSPLFIPQATIQFLLFHIQSSEYS